MVKNISTIDELLFALERCKPSDYVALAKQLDIPLAEFEPYLFWSGERYTRNCIVRTDMYELIILCWEKDQFTPIHCHGGEECWVKVISGTILEKRFRGEQSPLTEVASYTMKAPQLSYMNDDMGFHSLHNLTDGRAATLHLYMDPIDECNVMNPDTMEFEKKRLQYYSFEGEKLG